MARSFEIQIAGFPPSRAQSAPARSPGPANSPTHANSLFLLIKKPIPRAEQLLVPPDCAWERSSKGELERDMGCAAKVSQNCP